MKHPCIFCLFAKEISLLNYNSNPVNANFFITPLIEQTRPKTKNPSIFYCIFVRKDFFPIITRNHGRINGMFLHFQHFMAMPVMMSFHTSLR